MSKIETHGLDTIPDSGVLLIPNRLDFGHLLQVEKSLDGRNILLLVESDGVYDGLTQAHFGQSESISFTPGEEFNDEDRGAVQKHVENGGVALFVPGSALARRGTTQAARPTSLQSLCKLDLPALQLYIETPRDTILAIEAPEHYPEASVLASEPLKGEEVSPAKCLSQTYLCAERAFSQRPLLKQHLGRTLIEGLKRHSAHAGITDGMDGSEMNYGRVLAVSLALAKTIKKQTNKERVGIILPPGRAGLIANLAVIFAGKVPVNLNFTAGSAAVQSSIKQADIDKFITVDRFVRKMQSFPWPPNRQLIFLERILPNLKGSIVRWMIASKFLSARAIGNKLGLPKNGGDREAVLLFTSGSSGDPKGVALTHANILANVAQFGARLDLHSEDSVLGCLPLFHSFGCTVTLWYPIIEGLSLVTYPSPVETKKLAELIEKHEVSLMIATPTFLRGYLRRAKPEQLRSLKLVVTGAEKLPQSLREEFEKRFGHQVLEGYGLTETSPVTNFNLPDPKPAVDEAELPVIPSARAGSVGNLVPGLAIKITDPSTEKEVDIDQSGIIWFRGANVFPGYLGREDLNAEIFEDGWFRTGDIGRVDENGFLYIEGRLSRFSKIAGEMVPHERVEEYIVQALNLQDSDERCVVVTGIPDEQKGEQLILLTTTLQGSADQELIDLRYRLLEMKVPSLWIPRTMIPVEEIPVLASGKLDIKGCQQLAEM